MKCDINVTPLVAVLFVLVSIFMCAFPIVDYGVGPRLPSALAAAILVA